MQTYEIYINESRLRIGRHGQNIHTDELVLHFHGKQRIFFQIIDTMEKAIASKQDIFLVAREPYNAFDLFKSLFKIDRAAGGVIRNEKDELFFMFRRGVWDLPKGKMDPGETESQTAIREIREEVGMSFLKKLDLVDHTWHCFKTKRGKRILKKTAWFAFDIHKKETIQLQAEEDIEAYHWIAPELFLKSDLPTYRSIRAIVRSYMQKDGS